MTSSHVNTPRCPLFLHLRPNARAHLFGLFLVLLLGATAETVRAATITVPAGGSFQAALDSAQPGDTIELAAGASFTGPFTLPDKNTDSTEWITIRTSAPDSSLPPPGQRITPAYASVLPKIVSPGFGEPALRTAPRAHHYRFLGVEIAPANSEAFIYDLVLLGDSGPNQDSYDEVPHHIVLDRCYVHAYPTQGLKRGIQLSSAHTDILNSYVADFKVIGQDSQAIGGFNGPGPFKIINNYLEGAGENILFGGAAPSLPNLIPSDIEIRGNHFYKPLSWYEGDPSYAGQPWSVKNSFELKNAQRVVIEGNVFENNWAHSQVGFAILFTVRPSDSGPAAVVQDVRFANNIIKNSAHGVNFLGIDDLGCPPGTPDCWGPRLHRVTVANNLFLDIGALNGSGRWLQVLSGSMDVTIDHNTVFHSGSGILADGVANESFVFENNLMRRNPDAGGILGSGTGEGLPALEQFFPGADVRRNLIYGVDQMFGSSEQPCWRADLIGCYPADNFYPPDSTYGGAFEGLFANYAGGDYRLAASSPYRNAGTDGKDVGADLDAVYAATAGAVSGVWPSSSQAPFGGTAVSLPGSFEAESFDEGGEGTAYHDSDAGNNGGEYRSTDVDLRSKSTASNGFVVFNAVAGEWLEYTVNVTTAGYYEIGAYSASRLAGGTFHIEVDGVNVTGPLTAPTTGSWWTFEPVSADGIFVAAGTHVVRLALDTNGVEGITADFDRLFFNPSTPQQTPFHGTPLAVPGTLAASDFDEGGAGVAYADQTPGDTYGSSYRSSDVDMYEQTVLRVETGEWLEYTINVDATRSTYAIVVQLGADGPGSLLHVEVDGTDVTGPLSVPNTGNWGIWGSVIKTGVTLTAGQHVLRVFFDDVAAFIGFHSLRIVDTAQPATPFSGTAISLPGLVPASDFDQGGELAGYHDNTAGCSGDCWFRSSDVDLWDRIVIHASAGEWMQYSVDVAAAGTYTLTVQVAADSGGGTFHVELGGVDVTGPLTIPDTGGWNIFQTVTKTGVSLSAGPKTLRIVVDSNSPGGAVAGSFNSVRVQ